MAARSPETRQQAARIAALARWSRESPTATAERGQAGLVARFRTEVAAESPGLAPAELERRTAARHREHMARLALASARVRRRARAE